jgi:uncharacterized phiE125 gp8 family phage protein
MVDLQDPWPTGAPLLLPLWIPGAVPHLDLITPPTEEPISLDVAIAHLRALNTEEDDYITRLIGVTRRMVEYATRRSLMPQTWQVVMDQFPWGSWTGGAIGWGSAAIIRLPRPPIIAVESITYRVADGSSPVEQILDPACYQVDLPYGPYAGYGRLRPTPYTEWPLTPDQALDAVKITYQAGYVDRGSPAQTTVPEDLIQAMLLLLSELYKSRSVSIPGSVSTPTVIQARHLWAAYRVY